MIKFEVSSKERHEQMKSDLWTSIYCKKYVYTARFELRTKVQELIHNDLIMWQEIWLELKPEVVGYYC